MRRDNATEGWPTDPRYPESRLRECLEQLHLAKAQLDDEALVESLDDAIGLVEEVHSQISYTDDE